jgi:TetR/AcrR family transcriptional repressor of lmrAB and yxaGH operons
VHRAVVSDRLVGDGWSQREAKPTAQAVIALIEGALILARVAGGLSALEAAKLAAGTLLNAKSGRPSTSYGAVAS